MSKCNCDICKEHVYTKIKLNMKEYDELPKEERDILKYYKHNVKGLKTYKELSPKGWVDRLVEKL
jgi:hypothetical protein